MPRRSRLTWNFALYIGFLAALLTLASADDTPTLADLVKDLTHDDAKVRQEAAYQIRQLGPAAQAALPDVIKALRSDRQVWFHAVQTIAGLGPAARPAIPALMGQIADGGQTGYRVAYALSRIGPAAIAPLAEALKKNSDSVEVRVNVARALGWIGPPARETVPALAELLKDDDRFDERGRDLAAWALGRIGKPAVAELVVALSYESKKSRASALKALSMIGPEAAVTHDVVSGLIRDDAPKVRELAVTVLRSTQYPPKKLVPIAIERLSDADVNVRAASRTALLRLEPTLVVAPLEAAVKSDNDLTILSAADVLSRLGAHASATVPSLVDALERRESPETRAALGRALGRIGRPSLDPLLERIERSRANLDKPLLRAFALALAAIGAPAVPGLTAALDRDSSAARVTTAAALGEIGPPAASPAAPALRNLLRDNDDHVRTAAAQTLGALGQTGPITNDVLVARTFDDSPAVRSAAVIALRNTGLKAPTLCRVLIAALDDDERSVREDAAEGLVGLGKEAGDAERDLVKALEDTSPRVRTLAATALGEIEIQSTDVVVAALVTALKSSAEETCRCAVLETIGGIGPNAAAAVPAIISGAASENAKETERVLSIRVLGDIGEAAASAFPILEKTCSTGPPKVRAAAATALIRIERAPDKVVPILVKAIDDEALIVRLRAMDAIGTLGPAARAAEAKLYDRLFEGWDDRRPASEALEKIGPRSVPHLTKTLAHEHRFLKRFAAKHLGKLGADARGALPALRKELERKESESAHEEIKTAVKAIEAATPSRRVNL